MAAVLGLLLRVLNAAFAICALGLLGCSVYMDWQYVHHHAGPPGPQPSPSPEPSPEPEPSPPLAAALGSALAAQRAQQAPLVVEVLAAGLREAAVAAYPWFIYAVGATGAYLLLAAMVGVSGVQRGSRWAGSGWEGGAGTSVGGPGLALCVACLGRAGADLRALSSASVPFLSGPLT